MTVDARHSPNREDFIRGSDMVSLMQGKWNELYKIKMGQIGRKDLSHLFNVNLGTFTESFNMDWAKQNYDYKFANQVPFKKQYGSINLQGTLDGYDYENNVLIECKHTHSRNDMETVIDFYMPQIQFYMYLSNAKQGLLSVIFGNTYDAVVVDASDEYQTLMLDRIKMFWECVVHGDEPDDELDGEPDDEPDDEHDGEPDESTNYSASEFSDDLTGDLDDGSSNEFDDEQDNSSDGESINKSSDKSKPLSDNYTCTEEDIYDDSCFMCRFGSQNMLCGGQLCQCQTTFYISVCTII